MGLPAQRRQKGLGGGRQKPTPTNRCDSQNVRLKALLFFPEMQLGNIVEKTRVGQGKGQPHGRGQAKSSSGLYFPPQTPFKALFDIRKEARVSNCFLLQDEKESGRYFPACNTHNSRHGGFSLKDSASRVGTATKSPLLSKAAGIQETHSLLPTEKRIVRSASRHCFEFLKHFYDSESLFF